MIGPTDEMTRNIRSRIGGSEVAARSAAEAVLAVVERDQVAPLRAVLEKLLDPHACHYDHHGDCQEHGTTSERPCPHARAKDLLGWSAP